MITNLLRDTVRRFLDLLTLACVLPLLLLGVLLILMGGATLMIANAIAGGK